MNSYKSQAIFHLPALFEQFNFVKIFIDFINQNPQYLKDNVKIGSLYGSPTCIWNGGRGVFGVNLVKSELIMVRDFCEENNIPARFTFTNHILQPHHIYDERGNQILKIFNTGHNEIICNSNFLEQYIRTNYGNNYKYISSTTKRLNKIEQQNEELEKDYYLVVLDYDYNNNFEYLSSIKHKEKCEILCNPCCVPECPNRKKHYTALAEAQLNLDTDNPYICPFDRDILSFYATKDTRTFIKAEDINKYLDMGFNNFKLEGRSTPVLNILEIYLYYLIKDKFQEKVRVELQNMIW